jgi:hypothetical protein
MGGGVLSGGFGCPRARESPAAELGGPHVLSGFGLSVFMPRVVGLGAAALRCCVCTAVALSVW